MVLRYSLTILTWDFERKKPLLKYEGVTFPVAASKNERFPVRAGISSNHHDGGDVVDGGRYESRPPLSTKSLSTRRMKTVQVEVGQIQTLRYKLAMAICELQPLLDSKIRMVADLPAVATKISQRKWKLLKLQVLGKRPPSPSSDRMLTACQMLC